MDFTDEVEMMDEDPSGFLYTCKMCGSHSVTVVNEYLCRSTVRSTMECSCADSESGCAAEKSETVARHYVREGGLEGDHRVAYGTPDLEESEVESVDDLEVHCGFCHAGQQHPWIMDEANEEGQEGGNEVEEAEVTLRCGGCEREIEFGYSHPDFGGRLWPAECTDFNPWKSWPDPKYRESWRRKGWLRPTAVTEIPDRLRICVSE